MTNLLLTYKCNRSCPYCFAQERQKTQSPDGEMFLPWRNLVTVVNYLVEDRQEMVSVLGGEPTLHPEFVDIYRYIVARDLTVKMFSNGCVSHGKIEALLRALNPDKSRFIINVNEERDRQSFETKMQAEFFRELGMVSALSFNLFRPDPDLDFLLDLIGEYQLRRRIRIGLAHPIAGEPNAFLRPENYADIAARLADFARRASHQDVNLSLDCGFTLCDFTDEQLGMLHRTGAVMKFHCGPIIDIGPDLNTWACFPLSSLRPQPLEQYPSLQALKKFYAEYIRAETRQRRFAGVYKKCESCRYLKRHMCSGGCRSYAFEEKS